MREILFKGKRVDDDKWTEGYFYKIWNKTFILWGMTDDSPNMEEVIPETVGQYTGLTDKNGKKIFEGDICDMSILGNDHTLQKIVIKYGCVGYEPLFPDKVHPDDREWTSFWKSDEKYLFDTSYFTVIGNIHDNLELLEVEE